MSGAEELLATLVQGVSLLLRLAIVVAALVRLRLTPAGVLIAGGYTLIALGALGIRAIAAAGVPHWVWMLGEAALYVFYALVGVGILLIPSSLKRLAERSA